MVSVNLNIKNWKHIVWLPVVCVLLYGMSYLFNKILSFGANGFGLAFSAVAIAFLWYYRKRTALSLKPALNSGWALGLILAVFIGLALLSYTIAFRSDPGMEISLLDVPKTILPGILFGIASATIISVLPFIIVWRAFAGPAPGTMRKAGVILTAIAAIIVTSLSYNVGRSGFDRDQVERNVKLSLLTGIPTLISGNPLASPITGAFLCSGENLISRAESSSAPGVNLAVKKDGGTD